MSFSIMQARAPVVAVTIGSMSQRILQSMECQGAFTGGRNPTLRLGGGKLVPVIHGTTFAELNEESPMLASRNGLNTAETACFSKGAAAPKCWSLVVGGANKKGE